MSYGLFSFVEVVLFLSLELSKAIKAELTLALFRSWLKVQVVSSVTVFANKI